MMLRTVKKHPFFEKLQGNCLLLEELWDTPKALVVAHLNKRPIVVVTSGESENRLCDDLATLKIQAVEFPAWETLPGEEIAPSPDIVGRRLEILANLRGSPVILTPLQNLLQKVPNRADLMEKIATWRVGGEVAFDLVSQYLSSLGYRRENVCSDKGHFAVRGGIVDIFPISSPHPFRVEFFGDQIDQIRIFDPMSQKSVDEAEEFLLTPADESVMQRESHLLDYLDNPLIIYDDVLALEDRWVALKGMPGFNTPLMSPLDLNTDHDRIFFAGHHLENFELCGQEIGMERVIHPFRTILDYFELSSTTPDALRIDLGPAISSCAHSPMELYFYGSSKKELTKLKSVAPRTPEATKYVHGYFSSGFAIGDVVVIPDTALTGRFKLQRKKWRSTYHTPVSEFHELSKGDLVVHFHNGVGKYLGIEKQKNHLGLEEEFMIVEYAGNAKLFVPLSQAHLVSRYIGSHEEKPALHQIGSNKWAKAKASAQKSIIGYAKDMLQLQAEREAQGGLQCSEDSDDMLLFEDEFPYVETEDQLKAIADIKRDMQSEVAMDRLICGDVVMARPRLRCVPLLRRLSMGAPKLRCSCQQRCWLCNTLKVSASA